MRRLAAVGVVVAIIAIGRTARPLVPESERLTGADLPAKHLVLTFDQGPSTKTLDLSTYLKAQGIHATFFVDNRYASAKPTLTALANDGHLLGNRASTNRDLVTTVPLNEVAAELTATDDLIKALVPWNHKVFRAPFGSWTSADAGDPDAVYNLLATTTLNDYVGPVFWNVDADCSALATDACVTEYMQRIHARSNGIVRFDDTDATLDVVKKIVPLLATEGYTFDALDAVPALTPLFGKCDKSCAACTGPAPENCSACAAGARLVDDKCLACSVCQPGNYTVASCAALADTLCSPCPVTTYQPAPGTQTCLACGDCSDGDPCTTDSCQAVVGCTHTKIAGCPGGADASVSVPVDSDAGGSRKAGGKIDDENGIAVDSSDDASGCAMLPLSGRGETQRFVGFVVSMLIVGWRRRKRPLSS